ncbi:MAG: SDR family oxidoreductase [Saprospiraceae bacterium]|nr:SDR family oxidoreductase [Saprospiraceae bacterium]
MNKKVAIITGASRGIGRSVAERLFNDGYLLTLVADNSKELEETARALDRSSVLIQVGDLADLDFARLVVDQTMLNWGRVDVLVNNAAWRVVETLRTMTPHNWARTLDVCVTTPAFLSKWSAEHMEVNRKGVIINICSIMTERVGGTAAAYVASKGALLSLTYEMATLFGRKGIRVVAVSPGNIETQLNQGFLDDRGANISDKLVDHYENHTPLGRSGRVNEVSSAVSWLCSDEASYISGTNIVIDGGFSKNFSGYDFKTMQFPTQF